METAFKILMHTKHAMRTFFAYLVDKTEKRRSQRKSAFRKYLILFGRGAQI